MLSNETQSLQSELLELLYHLQNLNPTHFQSICTFTQHGTDDLHSNELINLLRDATPQQIDKLISMTVQSPSIPQLMNESLEGTEGMEKLPKEIIQAFSFLLQLYELQKLLNGISIVQLMKLFEIIPPSHTQQQLQLLEQLQQLLGQLLPQTLLSIQEEIKSTQPGNERQVLVQLLQLKKELFHIYMPIRLLLQLDSEELLSLQEVFPKLHPIQMRQLLELLQLPPYDVIELKKLFQTKSMLTQSNSGVLDSMDGSTTISSFGTSSITTEVEMEGMGTTTTTTSIRQSSGSPSSDPNPQTEVKRLTLRVVEQPPEKSVYKRNLKPNPMVQLIGDEDNKEPDLFVAPILLRCDTLEEIPKLLTGHKPIKVAPGKVVVFRKLKITSTSHQQGESLFAIKFELRKYHNDDQYEVLDYVQSNPICILSHSTQLKPGVATITATIAEVIPYSGSCTGGTRVAVLGNNFVDNPAARVRFDDTDVMPIFHGPRTLICNTPAHKAGIVSVRVSNDSKVWSQTAASFTYEEKKTADVSAEPVQVDHNFDIGLEFVDLSELGWQGAFDASSHQKDLNNDKSTGTNSPSDTTVMFTKPDQPPGAKQNNTNTRSSPTRPEKSMHLLERRVNQMTRV